MILSQIDPDTLIDLDGSEDAQKLMETLISKTGMASQIAAYTKAEKGAVKLEESFRAAAHGDYRRPSIAQQIVGNTSSTSQPTNTPETVPIIPPSQPVEEATISPSEAAKRIVRARSTGGRSGRVKRPSSNTQQSADRLEKEGRKLYENNPTLLKARKEINNAPTARARANITAIWKAKLQQEGIPIRYL